MIIYKNRINYVDVTATENVTLSSPYFLWNLVSEASKSSTVFLAENLSSATARYDQFRIIETASTINLSAATISLDSTGWYDYYIYEQSSATNFNLSLTGNLVEQGKCYVSGSSQQITYLFSGTPITYSFYTPNQ